MMSAAVKGKTLAQARSTIRAFRAMMSLHGQQLDGGADSAASASSGGEDELRSGVQVAADEGVALGDLEALQGVVKFPVRIKCATLSWHTLAQALDEAEQS
jgi:nitrogen fixation NifU-like protein